MGMASYLSGLNFLIQAIQLNELQPRILGAWANGLGAETSGVPWCLWMPGTHMLSGSYQCANSEITSLSQRKMEFEKIYEIQKKKKEAEEENGK